MHTYTSPSTSPFYVSFNCGDIIPVQIFCSWRRHVERKEGLSLKHVTQNNKYFIIIIIIIVIIIIIIPTDLF